MSQLCEFQTAAVKRICERLNDENGSRRFLLADEVGLGKTMVARGVLEELRKPKAPPGARRKGDICVYLCSNLEIAEQNRDKLGAATKKDAATRLTLIPLRAGAIDQQRASGKSQLFVFTPGTSLQLNGSTGIKAERRMLLACLYGWRPHKIGSALGAWLEFFRCGAAEEKWKEDCTSPALRSELAALKRSGVYRRIIAIWNKTRVSLRLVQEQSIAEHYLLDALYRAVAELASARSNDELRLARRNRSQLIGALRKAVAEAAIDFLAPDLVLVDEFQRFKEVIELAEKKGDLSWRLFRGTRKPVRVLILSATPYKAVTFEHEQEDHYRDFRRTLSFLVGARESKSTWLKEVDSLLLEFKKTLTEDHVDLPTLIGVKERLERRLKEVMCRTERNRYMFDEHKGIEERPDFARGNRPPAIDSESLLEFVSLQSFLRKNERDGHPFPSVVDFWKSCPSVLSFMDAGYAIIRELKERKLPVERRVLRFEGELNELQDRNLKFGALLSSIRASVSQGERDRKHWRYIWTRPTYLYYRDDFFGEDDPAKFLVFSRWRFVPKAISFIVSGALEPNSGPRGRKQPLELNSETLRVCAPLASLASLVDIADWATLMHAKEPSGGPTQVQLRQHVRKQLKDAFAKAGVPVSSKAPLKSFWPALFRLEHCYLQKVREAAGKQVPAVPYWQDVLQNVAVATQRKPGGKRRRAAGPGKFIETVGPWVQRGEDNETDIAFPQAMLEDAVSMVLASPAIAVMRTMQSLYGDSTSRGLDAIARTCFDALRTFFNKGYVQEVVRRHSRAGGYAEQVLKYCADAHFQAVFDEYGYLIKNVLQRDDCASFVKHIGRVFAIEAGTPNVNVPTRGGRIRSNRAQRAVNFALAFGDESAVGEGGESLASRKTSVRESFNSPFWPFVLATTSVGQEGLDFHLYCRDVVHWNLPSNPVDLEQREGRINRFDGLVVRRNIAMDYPLSELAPSPTRTNVWSRAFNTIAKRPVGNQHLKHGLFPHWIFEPVHGQPARIRRHLTMFEGSRDRAHYERLKKYLFYYRLAFGQARQQDLLDHVVDRHGEERLRADLQACMINLSPFDEGYAWEHAWTEAARLFDSPEQLERLLHQATDVFERNRAVLVGVEAEFSELQLIARRFVADKNTRSANDLPALAALYYLVNPFDRQFDGLPGVGFQDDMEIIRNVATRARNHGLTSDAPCSLRDLGA